MLRKLRSFVGNSVSLDLTVDIFVDHNGKQSLQIEEKGLQAWIQTGLACGAQSFTFWLHDM